MSHNLGRMSHRLAIMDAVRNQDEGGGTERVDIVIATIWARITVAGALETNTYSQLQQRVTHKAVIRYRDDIGQGQTAYWIKRGAVEPAVGATEVEDARALYIVTAVDADPDKRPGEFMELMLREGGNL